MIRVVKLLSISIAAAAILASCKRNPIERLVNPYSDADVPGITGTFPIYDEELKTGGGVSFIPGGENQTIDFSDKSSPRRTANQIRYSWNGGGTAGLLPGTTQHAFAGFVLLSKPTAAENDVNAGRDLSPAGYTRMRFWVRGDLAPENVLRIEGPDDGTQLTTTARVEFTADQLAQGWQEIALTVPVTDFQNVKSFMTVSIQYTQPPRTTAAGGGGTVFLDDVQYE